MKYQRVCAILLFILGVGLTACERPLRQETATEEPFDTSVVMIEEDGDVTVDAGTDTNPSPTAKTIPPTATQPPAPTATATIASTETPPPTNTPMPTTVPTATEMPAATPTVIPPANNASPGASQPYTVQAGDTLRKIGLKFGVPTAALAEFNQLADVDKIVVGQLLQIPTISGAETEESAAQETEDPPPDSSEPGENEILLDYVVQRGDTLKKIGEAQGVYWRDIADANDITAPFQIAVGQLLKIPGGNAGTPDITIHTVAAGETLFKVATQYGVSWPDVARANSLSAPYTIYTGQQLTIPGG